MTIYAAKLQDRAALAVTGEEAHAFLQGLVTVDMDKVSPKTGYAGALLTPQGKILFDLFIQGADGGYVLETGASSLTALAARLGFYKLRAKVSIELRPELQIVVLWGDMTSTCGGLDSRLTQLGYRAALSENEFEQFIKTSDAKLVPAEAYHEHRLKLGIPEAGHDYVLNDIFPQDANFDLLHGVDFEKGCYVGQEVVSRMHHKSSARKRMLPFQIDGAAPALGEPVQAGGTNLGTFGSAADGHALALIRIDRLEEALASKIPITSGAATLTPFLPSWADFEIAGLNS